MIKAYRCREDYEGYSTIIFAETAGKARYIAMQSGSLGEDNEFKDIFVRRIPALDGYYKGKNEMDWFDPNDRLAMVREAGYQCDDDGFDPEDCERCSAQKYCAKWEEYEEEVKQND